MSGGVFGVAGSRWEGREVACTIRVKYMGVRSCQQQYAADSTPHARPASSRPRAHTLRHLRAPCCTAGSMSISCTATARCRQQGRRQGGASQAGGSEGQKVSGCKQARSMLRALGQHLHRSF